MCSARVGGTTAWLVVSYREQCEAHRLRPQQSLCRSTKQHKQNAHRQIRRLSANTALGQLAASCRGLHQFQLG